MAHCHWASALQVATLIDWPLNGSCDRGWHARRDAPRRNGWVLSTAWCGLNWGGSRVCNAPFEVRRMFEISPLRIGIRPTQNLKSQEARGAGHLRGYHIHIILHLSYISPERIVAPSPRSPFSSFSCGIRYWSGSSFPLVFDLFCFSFPY